MYVCIYMYMCMCIYLYDSFRHHFVGQVMFIHKYYMYIICYRVYIE